jgi:DnaK suppressor protein
MTRRSIRQSRLGDMLRTLRRQTQADVRDRLHQGRSSGRRDVGDEFDHSDSDVQGDLALALLRMKMKIASQIDQALVRLDEGHYGRCLECDLEIAEPRLGALPFAVRCRACEDLREQATDVAPPSREHPNSLVADGLGF